MRKISELKIFKQEHENTLLAFCFFVTFIWGMLAHAYGFFNENISHDSLAEFYFNNNTFLLKIQAGRFLVPLYRSLFLNGIFSTWLSGCLALCYLAFSVYLVIKMFGIKERWVIVSISGIMVTNITVISLFATYMHEADADMLGLLLSVVAGYYWKMNSRKLGIIIGSVCIAMSIGLYQSYFAVTITLILFSLLTELLDGKSVKAVVIHGLKGLFTVICGGILYMIISRIVCTLTGILLSERTNVFVAGNINCFRAVLRTYYGYILNLLHDGYPRPVFAIPFIMGAISGLVIFLNLKRKKLSAGGSLLLVMIIAVLPFSGNLTYFLARGTAHDLMIFSVWLFYIMSILLIARIDILKINSLKICGGGKKCLYHSDRNFNIAKYYSFE